MTIDGIASVQARMAELQALVAPPRPAAPTTTAATTATAPATTGDDFQTLLASLTGTSDTAASSATPARGATAQSFVDAAQKYVGVPYVWGGESLDEGGLDCSGLVLRALADVGVTDVPRVARDQQTMGEPVASLAQALPGDLVVFGGGTHIGIYVGDGKMVDAPKPGAHVVVRDVYTTPTAIRRILPQEQATPVSALVPSLSGGTGGTGLSGLPGLPGLQSLSGLGGVTGLTGLGGTTGLTGLGGTTGLTGLTGLGRATGLTGLGGTTALTGLSGLGGTAVGTSATAASQRAAMELLASLSTRGSSVAGLATSLGVAS